MSYRQLPFPKTRIPLVVTHTLVSRFMKGIHKGSPPTPRYQSTWDVQPVLTYLAATNPVDKLDLKMLTLKLVMLIALVSAQRGQSLHILDIGPGCMKEVPDGYEFLLSAHIKQSRPGYKAPTVVLRAYPANPSLCVCTCLRWLDRIFKSRYHSTLSD